MKIAVIGSYTETALGVINTAFNLIEKWEKKRIEVITIVHSPGVAGQLEGWAESHGRDWQYHPTDFDKHGLEATPKAFKSLIDSVARGEHDHLVFIGGGIDVSDAYYYARKKKVNSYEIDRTSGGVGLRDHGKELEEWG